MKTVKLYGELGEKFGHTHTLGGNNIPILIRGMEVLNPGFKKVLMDGKKWAFFIGDNNIQQNQIQQKINDGETLHIYPESKGSDVIAVIVVAVVAVVAAVTLMPTIPDLAEQDPDDRGFFFNGGTNTNEQGTVMPVIYGVARAGSIRIGVGEFAEDI